MTVGEKLDEVMGWRGINQKTLSELTGISRSMISEYVRDFTDPPLSALQKMASSLDVSLWTLLNGEPMRATPDDFTKKECEIITQYRGLSKSSQELIDHTLVSLEKVEHRK